MKTATGAALSGLCALLLSTLPAVSCDPLLKFGPCPSELEASKNTECGTLKVPIDHETSGSETIDLFVLRANATGPNKLGSLFYNPGGPGGSVHFNFKDINELWSKTITASYDIIGVDPRGIGLSNPVECDSDLYNQHPDVVDSYDDHGFDKLVSFNKAFGQSCLNKTGKLVNFLDSYSTMKDFELVRQALNADKFNYLGYSYGTYLGQLYAELYPHNIGRMVLDGLTDNTDSLATALMVEAASLTATFEQFFQWCNRTDECVLKGQDIKAIFNNVTSGQSIPAPCSKDSPCKSPATMQDMITAAIAQLGSVGVGGPDESWATLSENLANAYKGDASGLATPLSAADNEHFIYLAVNCQDFGIAPSSSSYLKSIFDVVGAQAPLSRGYGETFIPFVYCAGWPAPVVSRPPRRLDPNSMAALPPILLVNSYYDPSTSAVWAMAVREMMNNTVNIWRNGSGHTSYPAFGDTSKAMDSFLVSGDMPADGTIYNS